MAALLLVLLPSGAHAASDDIPPLVDMLTNETISPQQLEASKQIGVAIRKVIADSVGEHAGLQQGDIIVGYDGVRLYEEGETWILRTRNMSKPDVHFVINRDGKLQNIDVHTPGDRVAGYYGTQSSPIAQVAGELGMSTDPQTLRLLKSYPGRAVALFLEWRLGAGAGANADWFKDNLARFLALRQQDYKDFGPVAASPVPFIEHLSKFYRTISIRYRAGPHVPDWDAYRETRTFWALYYPCPIFNPPAWGDPSISDPDFVAAMIADRGQLAPSRKSTSLASSYVGAATGDPADAFVSLMKAALLDGDNHGGWPYRHEGLGTSEDRNQLLDALRSRVQSNGKDWILYAYAMVGPLVLEQKTQELIEILSKISAQSPYLGLLSAQKARDASIYSGPEGACTFGAVFDFVFSNELFQTPKAAPFHLFVIQVSNGSCPYLKERGFDPEYVFSTFTAGFSGALSELYPEPPEVKMVELENKALSYYFTHQYKESYALCQQVEASDPISTNCQWMMGRIRTREGDHAAAQVHFEKALDLMGSAAENAPIRVSFIGELLNAYQAQGGKQALFRQALRHLELSTNQVMTNQRQNPGAGWKFPEKLPVDGMEVKAVATSEICKAMLLGSEGDWTSMATSIETQLAILREAIPLAFRQPPPSEMQKTSPFTCWVAVFDTACEQLVLAYPKMDEPAKALEIAKERVKLPAPLCQECYACRAEADLIWLDAVVNGPDAHSLKNINALIPVAKRTCDSETILSTRLYKAQLLALRGCHEEARGEFDDALQRIRATSDRRLLANALKASADNHIALQQPGLAVKEISEAVELFRLLGFKSEEPLLLLTYAQALADQGLYAQAMETLREGIRLCSTLKVPHLVLRTLLTLADVQRLAGDRTEAARTWTQITSFLAMHPNLPALTLLRYHQVRLDWLDSSGDASDFAAARQNALDWLHGSKLSGFQGLAISARASSLTTPLATSGPAIIPQRAIDLQPIQQRTEVDTQEIARAHFTLANPGTAKALRPVMLRCPGYAVDWTSQTGHWQGLLRPDTAAPGTSTVNVEIGAGEEVLLLLEAQPGLKTQQTASLNIENQTATWEFQWGDDKRSISIVNASAANDNPFYRVSFFHDLRIRDKSIHHANLRVETSVPCRVELLDADRDSLLAIDASGTGTFKNFGDLVYVDTDGDGYPDLSRQDNAQGAPLELRVYPLKDQQGKVEIKVSVKIGGKWEEHAIDVLNVR